MITRIMTEALKILAVLCIVLGSASGAVSAADEPGNAYKYRSNMMKILEGHLVEIVAILRGEVSHGDHLGRHAKAVKDISVMFDDIFPKGSDVEGSRAKPEIWLNWDAFLAARVDFQIQASQFAQVAADGDPAAVGAELGKLGKACEGCHKQFRKKKR